MIFISTQDFMKKRMKILPLYSTEGGKKNSKKLFFPRITVSVVYLLREQEDTGREAYCV